MTHDEILRQMSDAEFARIMNKKYPGCFSIQILEHQLDACRIESTVQALELEVRP